MKKIILLLSIAVISACSAEASPYYAPMNVNGEGGITVWMKSGEPKSDCSLDGGQSANVSASGQYGELEIGRGCWAKSEAGEFIVELTNEFFPMRGMLSFSPEHVKQLGN